MDLLGGVSEVGVIGGVANDGDPGVSGVETTGSGIGRSGVCGVGWITGSGLIVTGGGCLVIGGAGSTTGSGR